VIVRSICAESLLLVAEDHSPIARELCGGARRRSTLSAPLRPCVPHGLRALTPPALRSNLQLRDGRGSIAIDSVHGKAYVRNIALVPHGTPSTSPDVERFGTTLQGLVPTAS
jgi:hypothetical protein